MDDANVFGLSNFSIACILELTVNFLFSFAAVFAALLQENGLSSNQLVFITAVGSLLFSIGLDFYRYTFNKQRFFILIDIWKPEQRAKWFGIPYVFPLFVFQSTVLYIFIFLSVLSFDFANNVADVLCIANASVIFIPLVGMSKGCNCCCNCPDVPLIFESAIKGDWKHRYFVCLILIIVGCIMMAQPGFIFGYNSSVNPYDQGLAIIFIIIASVFECLSLIAATLTKKLILLDFFKDPENEDITQSILNKINNEYNYSINDSATLESVKVVDGDDEADSGTSSINVNANTPLLGKESINSHDEENQDSEWISTKNLMNSKSELKSPLVISELTIENVSIIIDNLKTTPQSSKFIVQNDVSLSLLVSEYAQMILVTSSALFSLLYFAFNNTEYSSFGDNFDVFSDDVVSAALSDENIGYVMGNVCIIVSAPFFIVVMTLKMPNALFIGVFNVCGTVFTFIVSYFLESSNTNVYEIVGIILVCLAILISVYPWNKIPNIPDSF